MYLTSDKRKTFTAPVDLPVLKLLILKDGRLLTPFMETEVDVPGILEAKGRIRCNPACHNAKKVWHFHGGMIHCYRADEDGLYYAKTRALVDCNRRDCLLVLVEGTIPAGTRMMTGYFGTVCARKVRLTKVLARDSRPGRYDYWYATDVSDKAKEMLAKGEYDDEIWKPYLNGGI